MRLDVLGAGPAYTDKLGAAGASYLMRAGSTAIVLDLGQGSFPRLAATLEPNQFDRDGAKVAFQRPTLNRSPDADPVPTARVLSSSDAITWSGAP